MLGTDLPVGAITHRKVRKWNGGSGTLRFLESLRSMAVKLEVEPTSNELIKDGKISASLLVAAVRDL